MASVQQARFQLFAPLSESEYAALKADIAKRGVLVPVELDEVGTVLDGHHRIRACEELGIAEYPRFVRTNLHSDAEKRAHVRALNLLRRHLSQEQQRQVIAEQLADTPERSNRQIAAALGVSPTTVGTIRAQSESDGVVSKLDTTTDTKGRQQPSHKPRPLKPVAPAIMTTTPAEQRTAVRVAQAVEPERVVSTHEAKSMAQQLQRGEARAEAELVGAQIENAIRLVGREGEYEDIRLREAWSDIQYRIGMKLLPLKAERVAAALDEGSWMSFEHTATEVTAWFEAVRAARRQGLRVVGVSQ